MTFLEPSWEHPKYQGVKKRVEIGGVGYDAFFPERHSSVKGIVLRTVDVESGNCYAKMSRWHTALFVMRKNNNWEKLYEGPSEDCSSQYDIGGYYPLLFSLEKESFKKRWLKSKENRLGKITGKELVFAN